MAAVSGHTVALDFGVDWGGECSVFTVEEGATVGTLQEHIFITTQYPKDQQILTANYWDGRIEQLKDAGALLTQVVKDIYRIRVELRAECYGCGCFS
jgi:hypothetical protein